MPDEEYVIDLEFRVMAESKIEAMEKVKAVFEGAEISMDGDVETEMFAELGIDWEE
jgi:hypothetical protein